MLKVERFILGDWQTNCYVLSVGEVCWLVDAGFGPEAMLAHVAEAGGPGSPGGLKVEKVVLTHAHVDHIAGLWAVRAAWPGVEIVVHEAEREFLVDTSLNLSSFLAEPVVGPDADAVVRHGEVLDLNGVALEVRHVPGHSPGGIALVAHETQQAIVGDTLFAGSIGRHDFPTSDGALLMRSIREQLLTLPEAFEIWPGHGPGTTVAREASTNPFLQ